MVKARQRFVSLFELSLKPSAPSAVPTHNIDDFLATLKDVLGTEDAKKKLKIDNTEHEIYLGDFRSSFDTKYKDFAVGFIAISDSTLSTPARRDQLTGKLTLAKKARGSEDEFGCHFFCGKKPNKKGRYPFFLENVERLGSSNIRTLLRSIMASKHKKAKSAGEKGLFIGPHKAGKNVDVGYNLIVDLLGIPSDELPKIVKSGLATSVSLQTEKTKKKFGGESFLVETRQNVNVRVDNKLIKQSSDPWSSLLKALKKESDHWRFARIAFEEKNGDKGSAKMDASTGMFIEGKFVRKVLIDKINPPLATSDDAIVEHFAKMVLSHPEVSS